jgi:4-amino-4-deoxy-L-arabinose transferase-like glycosyltransferase
VAAGLMLRSNDSRSVWGIDLDSRARILIFALIAVPFLVRIWLASAIPLTEDEAYYRLWALAPAKSYLDHPPMVAWMMAAGLAIAGDNPLGIRLPAILATAISTLVLWRTAFLLTDRTSALFAVIFASSMPLLCVGAIVMTPDTPSVLFVVLGMWALAELDRSRHPMWWLVVGVFAGLGLLSKYTNFFFGLSIVIWLVAVRANWRWFRSWQLYAGGVIALALFAPVIAWNIEHGGASFAKQFGRIAAVDGFKIIWQLEMWGALLLLVGPVLFFLVLLGVAETANRYFHRGCSASALLLALSAPLLIYFFIHALHGRVQANWPAPVYPVFAILAAIGTSTIRDPLTRRWSAIAGAGVSAVLSILIYAHALMPFYVSSRFKEPTHQLRGWQELATQLDELARRRGVAYIATTSYGTTGQLAFYLDRSRPVLQLDERIRYAHLESPAPELFSKRGLAFDLARRMPLQELESRFRTVELLGEFTRSYRGEPLQKYVGYVVADPIADPLGSFTERHDQKK